MKSIRSRGLKAQMQKGFTLVELAIVLVIAGIILVGVMKGTDSINKAKVERMVSDIRGLQASILEFQKRSNRLPGDCNNDGVIGFSSIATASSVQLTALDDATRTVALTMSGVAATATNAVCGGNAQAEDNANLVWNELRRAGVVDANRTDRELGRHQMGDVFLVSGISDSASSTFTNQIVVYGIPVWMAEAIDAELDGAATQFGGDTPANTGRVRSWVYTAANGTATKNPAVTAGVANGAVPTFNNAAAGACVRFNCDVGDRDSLVAISYQFDTRKLPN